MFLFETVVCSLSGYKNKCIAISDQVEVPLVIFLLILDMRDEEKFELSYLTMKLTLHQ